MTARGAGSEIVWVEPGSARHRAVLTVASELAQRKYLTREYRFADEVRVLGAFEGDEAVGFLLLLLQVVGREEGRPPIVASGGALKEGYVNAFGVLPAWRRHGIGQHMQEAAIALCEEEGCHQIRSRSPTSAVENYALKLKMGYVVHPSDENDSYFFLRKLGRGADGRGCGVRGRGVNEG